MKQLIILCVLALVALPLSAAVVQIDISAEMNFDAVATQGEIDQAATQYVDSDGDGSADNPYHLADVFAEVDPTHTEWYRYVDHYFANPYGQGCFYADPDDINTDGEYGLPMTITSAYGDYYLGAFDTPDNIAAMVGTPNAIRLGTARGKSVSIDPGTGENTVPESEASVDIDFSAEQQGAYDSVNLLMTGTNYAQTGVIGGRTYPIKRANVIVTARYGDGSSEDVWISPRSALFTGTDDGSRTPYGDPDPAEDDDRNDIPGGIPGVYGFDDAAGVYEASYIASYNQLLVSGMHSSSAGSPRYSTVRTTDVYMYEIAGGIAVDPAKVLVGLTVTVSNGPNLWVTGYPEGDNINIYAVSAVEAVGGPDPKPGDANGDDAVDIQDFVILKQNYGTTGGATFSQGDFNGDGNVDIQDFVILKQNYGS